MQQVTAFQQNEILLPRWRRRLLLLGISGTLGGLVSYGLMGSSVWLRLTGANFVLATLAGSSALWSP